MRIVFFGSPAFARFSLDRLCTFSDIEVSLVVSQPDRKRSRNHWSPTAVKEYALDKGIPTISPESLNREEVIQRIIQEKADFLVVIAYGQFIGKAIRQAYENRIINIHASLLPHYRGAAPIQRALLDDSPYAGVSAMLVTKEMDAGDVLLARPLPPKKGEELESYEKRLAAVGADLLLQVLCSFSDLFPKRQPQVEAEASYAEKITKKDGILNFCQPCSHLLRQIQVLHASVGTRFQLDGESFKVHHAGSRSFQKGEESRPAGTILGAKGEEIAISCKDGVLLIDEIQAPNRKQMKVRDFLNGQAFPEGRQVDEPCS